MRPERFTFDADKIPAELRERETWLYTVPTWDGDKLIKRPLNPHTAKAGSHSDPRTWAPFDVAAARAEREGGVVGFVFTANDPYCGIDLDQCHDPVTGTLNDLATDVLRNTATYTEVSVSQRGLKLIGRASLGTREGKNQKPFEIYDRLRFFALTGHHVSHMPRHCTEIQNSAEAIYDYILRHEKPPEPTRLCPYPRRVILDDDALLRRAGAAQNGAAFMALYDGVWRGRYARWSQADLALTRKLAFWTGNDWERIDRLFRRSGLYRDKWDRNDYRQLTLAKAIGG